MSTARDLPLGLPIAATPNSPPLVSSTFIKLPMSLAPLTL